MTSRKSSLLLMLLLSTWSACTPASPATLDAAPSPPNPDLAAAVDLAAPSARLLSVTPTTAKVNADTVLRITGSNVQLDQAQTSIWDFGGCRISAYSYTAVDASTCLLQVQVGAVPTGTCDLTLTKGGKNVAPTLKAAFSLVP